MIIGDYQTHPAADCFPMHTEERLRELADDIKANGLLEAILLYEGAVLDGRNRLKACLLAEVEPVTIEFVGDPFALVRSKNAMRRDLTEDQRDACLLDTYDLETEHRGRPKKGAKVALISTKKSFAKEIGKSERVAQRKITTKKKAPELHKAVKQGKLSANQAVQLAKAPEEERKAALKAIDGGKSANQVVAAHKRKEKQAHVAKTARGFDGMGKYALLLADPPWEYENATTPDRRIDQNHYATMTLEDIKNMDVQSISADNAVLYLWATPPLIADALEVMEAWGFTYRTHMIWDKEIVGMGHWCRQQHELLFVGVRGAVPTPAPDVRYSSVYREKRGKHSKKPRHYHRMLEKQYPGWPRVELFAREAEAGWDVWGNEVAAAV